LTQFYSSTKDLSQLPSHDTLPLSGSLEPSEIAHLPQAVGRAMRKYYLFLFPSHGVYEVLSRTNYKLHITPKLLKIFKKNQ
jgi:hypothetical protein